MATNIRRFALNPKEEETTGIRSRVKFIGNFKEELAETIEQIADLIEFEVPKHFQLHSITLGNSSVKVRVCDDDHAIDRTVNCMFKHKNDDVRYGNISIDLAITELSQKPRTKSLGKFGVTDRAIIKPKLIKELLAAIEDIY